MPVGTDNSSADSVGQVSHGGVRCSLWSSSSTVKEANLSHGDMHVTLRSGLHDTAYDAAEKFAHCFS